MSYSPEELAALDVIDTALNATNELSPSGDDWIASEWVLVVSWHQPSTGENHMTRLCAPHVLSHHRVGLLYEALKDDWDEE